MHHAERRITVTHTFLAVSVVVGHCSRTRPESAAQLCALRMQPSSEPMDGEALSIHMLKCPALIAPCAIRLSALACIAATTWWTHSPPPCFRSSLTPSPPPLPASPRWSHACTRGCRCYCMATTQLRRQFCYCTLGGTHLTHFHSLEEWKPGMSLTGPSERGDCPQVGS